jgi:ribosome-associated protein
MTDPSTTSARPAPEPYPGQVAAAVRAVLDKKAFDVVVLDLRTADGFTDFFVLCTGANPRQIEAIAEAVQQALRTGFGERPAVVEGLKQSEWVLLDYFSFIVHVFSRDARAYYALDRLWGNAIRHDVPDDDGTPG